jgi:hypothetical protein
MSELPESPLTPEEQAAAATEVGIEAIRRIHRIEREMLSRAVKALSVASGKTPTEVMVVLSEGLDEGYTNAMKQAYVAAGVVAETENKAPSIVTVNEAGVPQFGDKKIATPKIILP